MAKKVVSRIMLTLLLISMSTLAFNIQPVKASGTIYIRADGSIDPPTASISSVDNVTYYFTSDICDEIVVERSNIMIDGNGYTLQGLKTGNGFNLTSIHNATIQSTYIKDFNLGVYLDSSYNNTISGNTITNNTWYGVWLHSSNNNIVSENTITNNAYGVRFWESSFNTISGNTITNKEDGVYLDSSSNNTISGNTISNNAWYGVWFYSLSNNNTVSGNIIKNSSYGVRFWLSSNNEVYHNSFINNTWQWETFDSINIWDNDYPSGGNFWSDFTASKDEKSGPFQNETGSDGIWDDPNVIDENNRDRYPLTDPPHNVTIRAHCYTEGIDINVDITMDGSPTGYNTSYTFLGLTGIHTFNVPNNDSKGHHFKEWNTGENTTTIIVTSVGTYTAYYQGKCNLTIEPTTNGTTEPPPGSYSYWNGTPVEVTATPNENYVFDHWELDDSWNYLNPIDIPMDKDYTLCAFFALGIHDVAIIDVMPSNKTVVCKNFTMFFDVTVKNQGQLPETFGIAVPYNSSVIIPTSVQWDEFWSMGDVNRDGYIDDIDGELIDNATCSTPGADHWNPDADLDQDDHVGLSDKAIWGYNFGKNIWTYFNLTLTLPPLGTQMGVRLDQGDQTTLTFTLNTTFWNKGNYTLAYATQVSNETDTLDNAYGRVWVTIPGDITNATGEEIKRFGKVDIFDKVMVGAAFGATYNATDDKYWHQPPDFPGSCLYCPHPADADINCDGIVDVFDKVIVGANFGTEDP